MRWLRFERPDFQRVAKVLHVLAVRIVAEKVLDALLATNRAAEPLEDRIGGELRFVGGGAGAGGGVAAAAEALQKRTQYGFRVHIVGFVLCAGLSSALNTTLSLESLGRSKMGLGWADGFSRSRGENEN